MKRHYAVPWSTSLRHGLIMLGLLWLFPGLATAEESDNELTLVGRISCLEGKLLRFDNDQEQWIEAETDSPFGEGDALSSDKDTRAELMLPNRTWIRIGSTTQIELKELNAVETEIDLPAGTARFYNKNANGTLKVTTPFGFVKMAGNTSCDLYVDDRAVEVVALQGAVDFVHKSGSDKHDVVAGSPSLIADAHTISSGEGVPARAWNNWNDERDELWAKRLRSGGQSARHLPAPLQDDAYVFDQYGRWENVCYGGGYYYLWRPVYVGIGWSPFTVGRWMTWCGDYTWIPYEPFGYTTHHYGHWVYVGNYWYWAPPLAAFSIGYGAPSFFMSFGWYPGRVGWIHHPHHHHIGWVPLLPHEPYYCHHRWGRHCRPIHGRDHTNVRVNVRDYSYRDHAVIIKESHFRDRDGYSQVRIRNVGHSTISNEYEATAVARSIIPRTVNGAHTPGRASQTWAHPVGVGTQGVSGGIPGFINEQHSGGSTGDGAPRSRENPAVNVRTRETVPHGQSTTSPSPMPSGLIPETKETPPRITAPPAGTVEKGPDRATGHGKIYIPSRGAESEALRQTYTPQTLQQGARIPATINQTRENTEVKTFESPRASSGHAPSRPQARPVTNTGLGTHIPGNQSLIPAPQPVKEAPATSPPSPGLPIQINRFRPAPGAPHSQAESVRRQFPLSTLPRADSRDRGHTSYGGTSGYVPAPSPQPGERWQNRIPSEGMRAQERTRVESTPNLDSRAGHASHSGSAWGERQGSATPHYFAPQGGMQGYVRYQGKGGSGNAGQPSFNGMRRK